MNLNGLNKWLYFVLLFRVAACAEEMPVETFFRTSEYRQVALSPDGNYLGILRPAKQRVGVAVIDLKTHRANWAISRRDGDVSHFLWVNNTRLLFWLNKYEHPVAGFFAVNRDGTDAYPLARAQDWRTGFLEKLPHATNEILVTSLAHSEVDPETSLWFDDVYRMNVLNAKMTLVAKNPGHVFRWFADHEGTVKVGLSFEGRKYQVLYRSGTNAPWGVISEYDVEDDGWEPFGFEFDNKTLLVGDTSEAPTVGLYRFDPETRKLGSLAFRHASADVSHVFYSDFKKAVLGVGYETDKPERFWFAKDDQALQAGIDKALPGTLNEIVSRSDNGNRVVILAASDRTPGTYYLLDRDTMRMEKLFEAAEWFKPEEMAEMKPIQYTARDGLVIHGYLTLPKGSTGKNLPMIVNPHGGPNARDHWGFDREVQFLASRGYAVLRMNFRGSTGYGIKFLRAGYREWGAKQQDDITDGVKWAIAQGIADPKRIGIFGASYGGYAALVGIETTPELYKCALSFSGVSDIPLTLRKQFEAGRLDIIRAGLSQLTGDYKKDKQHLQQVSPLFGVDKVQVPVLLAHGYQDGIVPVGTARDMASALRKRGKLFDYIEKSDEAHGFMKEENQIELWKKAEAFLKANL